MSFFFGSSSGSGGGSDGADGKSVLNGSGAPSAGTGTDGDFYIDTTNDDIYGPKSGGAWGSATSLVGPTGPQGDTGPAGADGSDGSDGADGSQGPQGPQGDTGPAGPGVAAEPYCVTGSGVDITATEATLDLSTEAIANSNYSVSSDIVTVTVAGTYLISYSIVLAEDSTGLGPRRSVDAYVRLNGSSTISQSQIAAYNREASGDTGCSVSFLVTLSADDTLEIRCSQSGTATDISQGATQMSIMRVA